MPKPNKTVAMRQLEALGIAYSAIWQAEPTYDSESAAKERGLPIEQVVKSLLVVSPQKRYYLALLQGHRKLSLHKLGALLGLKGLSMAVHDDVATVTGYEPGSVSPLGLKRKLAVIVDEQVLLEERVSVSGGRHEAAISIAPADLVRATAAKVADVAQ